MPKSKSKKTIELLEQDYKKWEIKQMQMTKKARKNQKEYWKFQ